MQAVRNYLKSLIGGHIGTRSGLAEKSWSQEGEDRILWDHFRDRKHGFYVDVGAHHPFRFSNTQLFYRHGWSGINIDALPGSMGAFRRFRRRDTNLEIGVSEERGVSRFYVFNDPAINTFDEATAQKRNVAPWKIERVIEVPTMPLREILSANCPKGQGIDFLSVDAESRDLSVLRSNDWTAFRPEIVLAESYGTSLEDLANDPCAQFMTSQNYAMLAKTLNTVLYLDRFKSRRR